MVGRRPVGPGYQRGKPVDLNRRRESATSPTGSAPKPMVQEHRPIDAHSPEPELTNATVLVTGGAGFIGCHLVERLNETNRVRVLDHNPSKAAGQLPDDVDIFRGDVRNERPLRLACAGIDVVFHLAGHVDVAESIDHPRESHSVNVDGTLAVLEQARNENARVVYASSAAIYGHPETTPIPESALKEPRSPYGLGKLTGDHLARLYHDLYGLETVSLRYFNVYGNRQSAGENNDVITNFLEDALTGKPITVDGNGSQTRDFVHVSDVVMANLQAAQTPHVGEAFNIGSGSSVSIRSLAELVRDVVPTDPPIVHTDPRPGDIAKSEADISKAADRLAFAPTVGLREGLVNLTSVLGPAND